MKNGTKIMLIIALIILGTTFIGCNEENGNNQNQNTVRKIVPSSSLKIFIDDADGMRCEGSNGNCFDEVVVVGEQSERLITNFYKAVAEDNCRRFVSRYSRELQQYFEPEILEEVVNANLDVECNWDRQLFFVFKDIRTNEVVRAYPFNMVRR